MTNPKGTTHTHTFSGNGTPYGCAVHNRHRSEYAAALANSGIRLLNLMLQKRNDRQTGIEMSNQKLQENNSGCADA